MLPSCYVCRRQMIGVQVNGPAAYLVLEERRSDEVLRNKGPVGLHSDVLIGSRWRMGVEVLQDAG